MQAQLYESLHRVEEKHWWFVARREIVLTFIDKYRPKKQYAKILDTGCGTGMILKALTRYGKVWGIDKSAKAVAYSKAKVPEATILCASFPEEAPRESFDIITVLDVLEHIQEDTKAIHKLKELLAPQGILVITVPAFRFLWSAHDDMNEHKRRYTLEELRQKILESDLQVKKISYYNTLLFLPIACSKILNRMVFHSSKAHYSDTPPPFWINLPLRTLFSLEKYLLPFTNFPFGLSLIVVAAKK